MLDKLLDVFRLTSSSRAPRPELAAPRVPDGLRVYAIGDIHGRADLMRQLRDRILADADVARGERRPERVHVVYLGDYVDRGPDSPGVIDSLALPWPEGFEVHALIGNHEERMLAFLEEPHANRAWFDWGGLETLMSYGVSLDASLREEARLEKVAADLRTALPAAHLDTLRALKTSLVMGDYVFVHAGLRPGVPLDQQATEDLLWIRDDFLRHGEPFEKFVVHGHTIVDTPDIRSNRIGIDTGAYSSGHLTCLALEADRRWFIATGRPD